MRLTSETRPTLRRGVRLASVPPCADQDCLSRRLPFDRRLRVRLESAMLGPIVVVRVTSLMKGSLAARLEWLISPQRREVTSFVSSNCLPHEVQVRVLVDGTRSCRLDVRVTRAIHSVTSRSVQETDHAESATLAEAADLPM